MASPAIDQLTCLDCPALTGPLNFWGKRKHLGPEQVATSATGPVMAKEVVNVVRLLAEFVLLRVNAVHRLMFSMYIMRQYDIICKYMSLCCSPNHKPQLSMVSDIQTTCPVRMADFWLLTMIYIDLSYGMVAVCSENS